MCAINFTCIISFVSFPPPDIPSFYTFSIHGSSLQCAHFNKSSISICKQSKLHIKPSPFQSLYKTYHIDIILLGKISIHSKHLSCPPTLSFKHILPYYNTPTLYPLTQIVFSQYSFNFQDPLHVSIIFSLCPLHHLLILYPISL